MTEDEYASVLEYLRRAMREHDLAELDARLASELYGDTEERGDQSPPSWLLLRYLDLLSEGMQLHAAETASEILRALNEVARTEDGHPIEGVELRLTEIDRTLYAIDADAVDLVALPDLEDLIADLRAVRASLADQRERSE